ncbi:MAG: hypothetical protein NZ534_03280 [Bacteroidia bacterium]|nr:hypothetical protein [Bacteroidia bacterium]
MTSKYSLWLTAVFFIAAGCGDEAEKTASESPERKACVSILLFDKSASNRIDGATVRNAVVESVEEMVIRTEGKKNSVVFCHSDNAFFCGTIDGKSLDRGLKRLPWGVERFCRAQCDDEMSTSDCNLKERKVAKAIERSKQELDSLVWAYRNEPPSDQTATDMLSALVPVAREIADPGYGRKTLHIFSDMLTEAPGGRNFEKNPPPDDATARQWAQEDWEKLQKQYGIKAEGFKDLRVVCHTPPAVKNLQKVALYWRHLFEDVLQTRRVEGL